MELYIMLNNNCTPYRYISKVQTKYDKCPKCDKYIYENSDRCNNYYEHANSTKYIDCNRCNNYSNSHSYENTSCYCKGSKGDKGSQGFQGFTGQKGDKGSSDGTGSKGDKGDKGDTGDQGIQGIKGDIGDPGIKGDTGDQGIQGIKGDTGDQGIQGIKGDTGDQGIQGIKGDTGDQGIQGIKGDKGDTGDQGIQGIKGDIGDKGDKGDTGDKGDIGQPGLSGIVQFASGLILADVVTPTIPIVLGYGSNRTVLPLTGLITSADIMATQYALSIPITGTLHDLQVSIDAHYLIFTGQPPVTFTFTLYRSTSTNGAVNQIIPYVTTGLFTSVTLPGTPPVGVSYLTASNSASGPINVAPADRLVLYITCDVIVSVLAIDQIGFSASVLYS
jgi:hypothetical protein